IVDQDGDVRNNMVALRSPELCIKKEEFSENGLHWELQVIQYRASPNSILWEVPHDNEHAAFDTAVYGVTRYHGTVIAVEAAGQRLNESGQDPNRNFNVGPGRKCPQQIAPSPEYTNRFLQRMRPDELIIALHTNERGFQGDGAGGAGTISMLRP